jgi:hypothetical protein
VNNSIRHLLDQISALEGELRMALHEQESRLSFEIKGRRIEFEQTIRDTHRRLKVGMVRWLLDVRPQNFLCAPVIYGMIVPLVLFDICITFYQAFCFPIFRITKVPRADYLVFDRRQLEYLNAFEKFHCVYCEYANGLIAYAAEIIARTEQYFCPIKHAKKVLGSHARYARFLAYGEAADYQKKLEAFRAALATQPDQVPPPR